MSRYTGLIAVHAGLPSDEVEKIRMASIMHDIGKIGIPDEILRKQGKFTVQERLIMQSHAEIGYQILSGTPSELLSCAATIALTHHERVDGTGYPRGLSDEEIPLGGRIAAIADVFDALTSARVYKDAFPLPKAISIMQEERNKHFDSELLDVFLDHISEAVEIMNEAADPAPAVLARA
jgi:putative two-component system response regulator